jgi:hypothetical protein
MMPIPSKRVGAGWAWVAGILLACSVPAVGEEPGWEPIFNGRDLSGWETWLATPPGASQPLGLNQDPLQVFSVEDGSLRISGQVFGGISSLASYGNFHLRLEQRWGERRWPPREQKIRDSGILYYATGDHGVMWNAWKASVECQVQEGEFGDLYPLQVQADLHARQGQFVNALDGKTRTGLIYDPAAPLVPGITSRVLRSATTDLPSGTWNQIEIIARDGICTHRINGVTVLELANPQIVREGQLVPLRSGQFQIQSEGAEVWYRRIEVRQLP